MKGILEDILVFAGAMLILLLAPVIIVLTIALPYLAIAVLYIFIAIMPILPFILLFLSPFIILWIFLADSSPVELISTKEDNLE